MNRRDNNNKKIRHDREENEIVPLLCSVLCPHSVIPSCPLTRKNRMVKPYTSGRVLACQSSK